MSDPVMPGFDAVGDEGACFEVHTGVSGPTLASVDARPSSSMLEPRALVLPSLMLEGSAQSSSICGCSAVGGEEAA